MTNVELNGLRNIIGSANLGGIAIPDREDFDTDEAYDAACFEMMCWKIVRDGESAA